MIGCTDDCLLSSGGLLVSKALSWWLLVQSKEKQNRAEQRKAKQSWAAEHWKQSRVKKSKAGLSSRVNWRQSRALTDMAQLLQLEFVSSASQCADARACWSSYQSHLWQIATPLSLVCLHFKAGVYQTSRCADARLLVFSLTNSNIDYMCADRQTDRQEHFKLSMFSVWKMLQVEWTLLIRHQSCHMWQMQLRYVLNFPINVSDVTAVKLHKTRNQLRRVANELINKLWTKIVCSRQEWENLDLKCKSVQDKNEQRDPTLWDGWSPGIRSIFQEKSKPKYLHKRRQKVSQSFTKNICFTKKMLLFHRWLRWQISCKTM